jgi:hypothetical protein
MPSVTVADAATPSAAGPCCYGHLALTRRRFMFRLSTLLRIFAAPLGSAELHDGVPARWAPQVAVAAPLAVQAAALRTR